MAAARLTAVEADCQVIRAWIRREVFGSGYVPSYRRDSQVIDDTGRRFGTNSGSIIYSYGRHFPIAEVHKPRGRRPLILLNGDRWRGPSGWHPSRTDSHQAAARDVAGELAANGYADTCIIPLAALEGGNIVHGSIRVLEQRDDTWVPHERAVPFDLDDIAGAHRREEFAGAHGYGGAGLRCTWIDEAAGRQYVRRLYRMRERSEELETESYERRRWTELAPTSPAEWIEAGEGWLDESSSSTNRAGRDARELARGAEGWRESWTEHRLGELLFTARAGSVKRRRRFVSSFDYQERAPLYFLAELPASSRAQTVREAIEDLAPRAVHAALARSIPVYRQGDMFAIQTELSDADVYARAVTRSRLAPFRGNGRPRAGELGYIAPAKRRAMVAARYRAYRHIGGFDIGRAVKPAATPRRRAEGIRPAPDYLMRKLAGELEERTKNAVARRRQNRAAGRMTQTGAGRAMIEAIREAVPSNVRFSPPYVQTLADVPAEYRAAVLAGYAARRAPRADGITRPRYGPPAPYSALAQVAEWPAKELARVQLARRERRALARGIKAAPPASDCYARAALDIQTLDRQRIAAALTFYGTAHTATEVIRVRGGAIYARGRISHATELETVLDGSSWGSRAPDHRPVKLGTGREWFLIVRNTVPRAR